MTEEVAGGSGRAALGSDAQEEQKTMRVACSEFVPTSQSRAPGQQQQQQPITVTNVDE